MKFGILVVEDNLLNRELLCDWLEMEGYEVWSATDLQTSYDVFAKKLPDAVLLDINLGAENGLDLVAAMRQKPEMCEIPVIAVTAHAMAWERRRILNAGCNACLSKPIDFQLLREELNGWLQDRIVSRPNSWLHKLVAVTPESAPTSNDNAPVQVVFVDGDPFACEPIREILSFSRRSRPLSHRHFESRLASIGR